NYYSYEGNGDYYYGATAADVVINSSPYGYGWAGSNYGFGSGYGYGYGSGYGGAFGFGYGWGYPGPYYYGYQPIWWQPSYPNQNSANSRGARVEHDRAVRAGLIRRDTVQAPVSAKWRRTQPGVRSGFAAPSARRSATGNLRSSPRPAPTSRTSTPVRSSSIRSAPAPMSRSAPAPAPVRSAPSPRPSSRRD
ncbi:MAG TPA: hypothetical protein VFN25_09045, partial [Dokdonella sp.]|uniref:hypothetical protein n=1 Tax=Dokdonella sp. TaxID=2291710 RepID=UPI002DACCEA5|nr:hypothetical protein [Dokdonella sp.]